MHTHAATREAHTIERRVYTIPEFLAAFRISRTAVYAEIRAGRLIARRAGGRTLIARDDADSWLSSLPLLRTGDDI